ncbi:hypothetical protein HMPREF1979_01429 [Actinomyces johnsonii F0542]|uniref:Uncharacterized protein n=2 Tax=Actinomyces johnsonii TaxID=544581 RepID=U1Q8L8_9ACTO|nr:hypothetical protein [Actinomyces johnsonii]ERH15094.1 hypothetical protein HMPREF1549_03378 [Actinomyces johnsonii F0510]ERH24175.1 hypothetical protein HMPREF1979_01429 [Actinomyces johnsonii F0542]
MIADVVARTLAQWTPEDPASCDPAWAETMRQDLEQAQDLLTEAIASLSQSASMGG